MAAADPIGKLETSPLETVSRAGKGVIHDTGHPMHPGDSRKIDVVLSPGDRSGARCRLDRDRIGRGEHADVDRYFVRHGRIFQVDDKGAEIPAATLAGISPAAVAAFHPVLVAGAMRDHRGRGPAGAQRNIPVRERRRPVDGRDERIDRADLARIAP